MYGDLQSEELTMSEEDTYVRAKLTEINGAIERLTQMLNRMIDVISAITEVQENTSELTRTVNANTERLDALIQMVKNLELGAPVASASKPSVAEKGAVSNLQSVLDTLETQVREGVIASDLAQRINESAEILEGKGVAGSLVVKMQRWTRILRTYGRVDTISPTDIAKLRADIKEWGRELSKMR
jgi:chromosome segregation ATPase